MNPGFDPLNVHDRGAFAEAIGEMERVKQEVARRNLRWPCFGCCLRELSQGTPRASCTHAEPASVIYETALREFYATSNDALTQTPTNARSPLTGASRLLESTGR